MVQQVTDHFWQAEARTEETKQFIRDVKRLTRGRFTAEEKIRIVLEGLRCDTAARDLRCREGHMLAHIILGSKTSWRLARRG